MRPRIVPPEFATQRCNCWQVCIAPVEPVEAKSVCYRGTAAADKISASIRYPRHRQEKFQMVITAAHIQPIVALLAGILILIMPRLLNLIVAIYLICVGLIGLGLLKWLHM
jgi:hypothetical protein